MLQRLLLLFDLDTYKKLLPTYQIMLFYCIVMIICSTIGYVLLKRHGVSNGFMIGVIISVVMWFQYGSKMTKL